MTRGINSSELRGTLGLIAASATAPPTPFDPTITLDAPLPLSWLVLIVAATALIFLWHTLRQWRAAKRAWLLPVLWLLRVLAVTALAAMVAGPSLTKTNQQIARQSVTILVDSSGSMSLREAESHTAEWAKPRAMDVALGSMTAALFQLQALEKLPAQQLTQRLGIEHVGDAATALNAALAGPGVAELTQLQPLVARLNQLNGDLAAGRSVVLGEARSTLAETLKTLRALLPKLQPTPAPGLAQDDKAPTQRRLQRIAQWLIEAEATWLAQCRKDFDVEVIDVGENAAALTPETLAVWPKREPSQGSQHTDIASLMDEAGRAATLRRSRAIVVVTDGAHNTERDATEAAARLRGLPTILVPIGASLALEQKDLALTQVAAPRSVFLHDTIQIEPQLAATGFDGKSVDVVLKDGGIEFDRQQVRVQNGSAERALVFQWKPASLGAHALTIEVLPLPGDTFLDNNKRTLPIEVQDDSLRLIIADSEPRWETRYLLNLLKRDERMSFTTLLASPLFKADGKTLLNPKTLPASIAEWAQYRIAILGDVGPEQLSAQSQASLVQFITERGGTLIVIAGSDAMPAAYAGQPLATLLPVTAAPVPVGAGFGVRLGASGRRFPLTQLADSAEATDALWQGISSKLPIFNLSPYSVAKPQATVLLEAALITPGIDSVKRSFLSYQDVGKGRVVFLAAPASWHLRYTEGDAFHYRFWGQLIHWAVARDMETGSRCVRLSASRPSLKQDESVKIALILQDLLGQPRTGAASEAVVTAREKELKTVPFVEDPATPGTYHATLADLPLGSVNITARGQQVSELFKLEDRQGSAGLTLNVTPTDNREQRELLRDQALLTRLAQASSGALLPPYAVPSTLLHLGLRPTITETSSSQPLWDEWPLLLGLLALLTLEWSLRRVAGVL